MRDLYCTWPIPIFCGAWEKSWEKLQNPANKGYGKQIPSGFCMEHSAMPLSPLPRSLSIFHGERCPNRSEAPVSHHNDFTQRQVQVNKVGYIFLVLHIFLDVCKNSNKQPGHKYCKSQHLRLRWGKEISTGKRHEQNLSKYFQTVYLYKPKSSGKWKETF